MSQPATRFANPTPYNRSALSRWIVLFLVATSMMMGYVFWDMVSPISTSLKTPFGEGGMGWTSAEYGFYAGSYSIFNIFLFMLFFGGIILDKCGIRFTGLLATGVMFIGALINYYAVHSINPTEYVNLRFTLFGLIPEHFKLQVLIAALGFGLFGMGCDITGITVSKVVTKWFTGYELASAMGTQVAMARMGTAGALSLSPLIARSWGISAPILVGAIILLFGFACFAIYCFMDHRFDRQARAAQPLDTASSALKTDEAFHLRDILTVLRNPGFWLIALLCVFFYSSTELMVTKYGIAETTAGWIVAAIPYGSIVLTPLFGSLYDRIGHGARLMIAGCAVLTACHVCLMLPMIHTPWFALIIMLFVGVAFSLVPSALWPSIPKLVPLKQLGSAYSIIYYVQNVGLMLVPIWVGDVIDTHTRNGHAVYTLPMTIFALFALLATIIALALLYLDKRNGYGLE